MSCLIINDLCGKCHWCSHWGKRDFNAARILKWKKKIKSIKKHKEENETTNYGLNHENLFFKILKIKSFCSKPKEQIEWVRKR